MVELCKRFVQDYKDSRESLALCTNVLKIANSELAAQDVEIDNIPRQFILPFEICKEKYQYFKDLNKFDLPAPFAP